MARRSGRSADEFMTGGRCRRRAECLILRVDESPFGRTRHVPPSASRRAPGPCPRCGVRRTRGKPERNGLGHAHRQPPVADGLASPPPTAAPTPSPTPSPTLTPATPSPTVAPPTPSPTPTTMIVRAYFLLRRSVQRRRGRQRAGSRSGPPDGAQERGDGNGRDEGAARGTIGQGASGDAADRDAHPRRLEAPRDRDLGRPRDGRPVRRVRLAIP